MRSCTIFGIFNILILILNLSYNFYFTTNCTQMIEYHHDPLHNNNIEPQQLQYNNNTYFNSTNEYNITTLPQFNAENVNQSVVIFGAFFASKKDPQRPSNLSLKYKDCYNYMKYWYESIHQHKLHAVLFHDTLSDAFVKEYTTEYFSFYKVKSEDLNQNLFGTEWRFIAYHDYLLNHQVNFDYVIMTDTSDVVYNKHPLEFMVQYPDKDLFFAFEEKPNLLWIEDNWERCSYGKYPVDKNYRIFCAGLWGGKLQAVYTHLYLLKQNLLAIAEKKASPGVCDMISHVKVANEFWASNDQIRSRIYEGQPFFNKVITEEGEPGEPPEILSTYYIVHAHRTINCVPNAPSADNGWAIWDKGKPSNNNKNNKNNNKDDFWNQNFYIILLTTLAFLVICLVILIILFCYLINSA